MADGFTICGRDWQGILSGERIDVKYLVTGAAGFVGPYLIRRLLSSGQGCRCIVRSRGKAKESLVSQEAGPVEIVEADITKPETLYGMCDGIDTVIHMATLGHMSHHKVPSEMFDKVNVDGSVNVAKEALRARVPRFIHCSSVAAMGICEDVPATEESFCKPHHPYGLSKLRADQEIQRLVNEAGLPAVIVRFSMVYGPGDHRDVLRLVRLAKKGLIPRIGKRTKLTPLIHVEDAVKGLLLAAERGRTGEVYLITNEASEPFDHLVGIIREALGSRVFSVYIPEWAALLAASLIEKAFLALGKSPPVTRKNIESTLADRVFSVEKAKRELGFEPATDVEMGLKETVSWYIRNGWL
jgi:dihydroflavonol-4-reductase